ncbi:50S ribosomal protein L25/general stress protein Ctc [Aquibacillus halophilus]|uniref:Large ribosomal subunit protein bL25 n=1 Tax=Aquibacillus halophilus TaxID=930132 RepID=A0A6A8DUW8_9BACI|nr:50S ribosomal protein L25/general stress protein Ctc [Aquibacillus halophilus]MRH44992.1 50S ribosomal protein L25/general stress protein Ctc [Aquibacillus halophilus]
MAAKLKADPRQNLKKSYTKQLRQAGLVPAVVYGNKKEPQAVAVNSIELIKTIRDEGRNAIISLSMDGESVDVMLHEYQTDPLRDELVHADFYIVNMTQEMDVEVAIHLDGEAQGSKDGGVLQQPLHRLSVRAKPRDIPEEIKLDVSKLEVGDSITVADLKDGKNYEILDDENTTIVTVLPPDTITEDEEESEDELEEPEVINEKASEDEEK